MIKKLCLIFFLSLSSQSFAMIYVEPIIGYRLGSTSQDTTNTATNLMVNISGTSKGIIFGGRAGVKLLTFAGGIDYMLGTNSGSNAQISGTEGDHNFSQMGLFAKFAPPLFPFSFWVGYNLSSTLTIESSSGDNKFEGSGFKLGLGFTTIPFLSINAEYSMNTYNKLNSTEFPFNVTSSGVTTKYDDLLVNSLIISLSVPWSL